MIATMEAENKKQDEPRKKRRHRLDYWIDLDMEEPDLVVGSSDKFLPTGATPGSSEKIEVLRFRVANSLPLWHINDYQ